VITSDTAVAHLSAALGQTTWLLLNTAPDWRWGLSGENTFWYPNMRLFRQTSPGDWNQVMKEVKNALQQRFDYTASTNSRVEHQHLNDRSIELIQAGNLNLARDILQKLVDDDTSIPNAYNNLAVIHQTAGRHQDAIPLLKQAIKLAPEDSETHFNLGVSLQEDQQLETAIHAYEECLLRNSRHIDALINLGNVLKQQERIIEALAQYRKAISYEPDNADAYNNQGNAQRSLGQYQESIHSYQQAIRINPKHAEAHNNLGNVFQQLSQVQLAISSYIKAIDIRPDYAEAHKNLALSLLSAGNYPLGWQEYRWRTRQRDAIHPHARPRCNPWQGESIPAQEPLLLLSEQGLGDSLHFMRYTSILQQQGFQTRLCVQEKLHGLVKASGLDLHPLSPEQGNAITKGQWISLMSLPEMLGVTPEQPLVTAPYLKTTSALQQRWKKKLERESAPVLGIHWQGNPVAEKTSLKGRSLPLQLFEAIASSWPGPLLSLQKGPGSEQLTTCSFASRFVVCQKEVSQIWDFLETAAMIQACELVITSDTAVAHLSAALGQKTWLLLNTTPDWRWGLSGENTFWYPSMRLFRQRSPGDWYQVMQDVSDALKQTYG